MYMISLEENMLGLAFILNLYSQKNDLIWEEKNHLMVLTGTD